jgi:hypothetical protein
MQIKARWRGRIICNDQGAGGVKKGQNYIISSGEQYEKSIYVGGILQLRGELFDRNIDIQHVFTDL